MEIRWINNSCFLIKNSIGKKILIDPIQISTYIQKYDLKPDIITFSHTHNSEFINKFITNDYTVINSDIEFKNNYFNIKGFLTYKDNYNGYKRGENIIYIFEIDNYKLCHLGLLGHLLDIDLINKLSNIDFLFIPIGGNFCLDGYLASKVIDSINPKFIIPMSFKTSDKYFYFDSSLKFLSSVKNVLYKNSNTIYSNELDFSSSSTVILLKENNKEPL